MTSFWTKALSTTVGVIAVATLGAPVSATAAGATPECASTDLTASYHAGGAATSHRYGRIVLTNVSDRTCTVGGYGGLSYVGHGDGRQIGAAAVRDTIRTARTHTLQPGDRVRSRVEATVAGVYPRKRCHPTAVDGFRVYVPNSTVSQYVAHPTTGCRNPAVDLLSHRAYR